LDCDLKKLYKTIQPDVESRLAEFSAVWNEGSDEKLWLEMCFCACTPQNDAKKAWNAVLTLKSEGLLADGSQERIAGILRDNGVRFHNNKALSIIVNRETFFPDVKKRINAIINEEAGVFFNIRGRLAKTARGWGLKEASHFLRNIGFGNEICILDRHILRRLVAYGAIEHIPKTLGAKDYFSIEREMAAFAKKTGVPLDALDLVFWYEAKGELFK
jgi:N-glycosylase/DNA lyase